MYAVIETGGKQYKVEKGATINVEKIKAPIGQEVELNRVLLVCKDDDVVVGSPIIDSAKIIAQVIDQARGKKITIMKFKRRKHYKRKMGHRQDYTQLFIKTIEM